MANGNDNVSTEATLQSVAPTARERKAPVGYLPLSSQSQTRAGDVDEQQEARTSPPPREDGTGRNDLDQAVERAVQGLRTQLDVMAYRVAQLETELAEQGPPDYTSSYQPL